MKTQEEIQKVVQRLQENEQISFFQAQKFLKDLKSKDEKIEIIRKMAETPEVNQLAIKYFIKDAYRCDSRSNKKGKTHPLMKKQSYEETTQQSKQYKLQKIECQGECQIRDIIQLVKDEHDKLKIKTQFVKNAIIQSIIFRDQHRLRHKNAEIVNEIFLISSFKCYMHESNGKIHSHNSKINYVTEIFQNHPKYQAICNYSNKTTKDKVFCLNSNAEFMDIFGQSNGLGVIIVQEDKKFFITIQIDNFPIQKVQNAKEDNIWISITLQLCWKLAEMNLTSLSDLSIYSIFDYFSKSWLQLLQLTNLLDNQILLFKLKKAIPVIDWSQQEKQNCSFQNLLNNSDLQDSEITEIKQQVSIYQQLKSKQQQNLRLYKKYLSQPNCVFLDFNYCGRLNFISNKSQRQITEQIKRLWGKKEIQISDIFFENKKLHSLIRKGSKGHLTNGKYYDIGDMKARVFLNEDNFIQRIHILVQEEQLHSTTTLSQQKNASTKMLSEKLSTGKRSEENQIMNDLERDNPGIKNQGWISLFLKANETKNVQNKHKNLREKRTKSQNNMSYFIKGQKPLQNITDCSTILNEINIDSVQLNVLSLQEDCLEPLAIKIMCKLQFFKEMTQQKKLFTNFLTELHENYQIHSNPFHNFIHGINVMHTSYLLSTIPKNKQVFSPFQIFTNVFSALCHDVGHTGFTNPFQIASRSEKALIYNDNSPLENFHASRTFQILRKPNNNFLCLLKRQQYNEFRKEVISNILYTDIKQHFPLLKKFQDRKAKDNLLTPDDATILSGVIIHCSDFGGSVKQFQISREWSERVNRQFSNQYLQQGKLGLPQTSFMKDLNKLQVLAKNESGFLKIIVLPLYQGLNQFYVDDHRVKKLLNNLTQNIKIWEQQLETLKGTPVVSEETHH